MRYYETVPRARGTRAEVDSLLYHLECAKAHTEQARQLCKKMRIATRVMYVQAPRDWKQRGVWYYIRQVSFNAKRATEYMRKEGKVSE